MTARGERFDDVVRRILQHPAYPLKVKAIGVNCTKPEFVTPLLRLANKVNVWTEWKDSMKFKRIPYVVYPNSGEDWDEERKCWSGIKVKTWQSLSFPRFRLLKYFASSFSER